MPVATVVDDIKTLFISETPSQTMPLTKIEPMITGKGLRC